MRLTFGHEPVPPAIAQLGDHFEMTIHITPEDMAALGGDVAIMTDWFTSALRALVALRTGEVTTEVERGHLGRVYADANTWYWVLNDLEYRLAPRLKGIRDAAIRAHEAAGGSVSHLGLALDVPKSTAQSRRERVLGATPSNWEKWASRPTSPDAAVTTYTDTTEKD